MQRLIVCAIAIDDVRDFFRADELLGARLRSVAAKRFAPPVPVKRRLFAPLTRRDPNVVADPSQPDGADLAPAGRRAVRIEQSGQEQTPVNLLLAGAGDQIIQKTAGLAGAAPARLPGGKARAAGAAPVLRRASAGQYAPYARAAMGGYV